jgi:hypothetical protein
MAKFSLSDFEAELPEGWTDQGMLTLTMPSHDKNVRPNVIVTKEILPQGKEIKLEEYFERIKASVQARGIESFKILSEKDVQLDQVAAKMMICTWDLSAMKQMMGGQGGGGNLDHIKPGQMVQQIQVSCVRANTAINLTASFPADQFETYSKPFQAFVRNFKFK